MPNTDLKTQIEQLVESRAEEITDSLRQILRFQTVSGAADEAGQQLCKAELAKCMEFLEGLSTKAGFEWKNHENIYAFSHLGNAETFIGLPVHIDVVPAGENWTKDPFGGEVENDIIYGRGCQDDKGPVVQMFYAMEILKELGLKLKKGARLVVGTTEEFGDWYDIKAYFENETAPEFSIVSDAAFPIINGEKGIVNLVMTAQVPSDPRSADSSQFLEARSGERSNIVPNKAELLFTGGSEADVAKLYKELERFLAANPDAKAKLTSSPREIKIVFHGKGAHGSTPELGRNAALDLLKFLSESAFANDDEADMAEFLYTSGSSLNGVALSIDHSHPFIGDTTVNLGILKWVEGEVEAVFNIRNTMGLTVDQTVSRAGAVFEAFAEETGFEISAAPRSKAMNPIFVDPETHPEFISALQEAYTVTTGRDATLHAIGGTTYSKVFPNAVCFGPVDPADEVELAHQADERVSIANNLRNVKIYAYALAKLCA